MLGQGFKWLRRRLLTLLPIAHNQLTLGVQLLQLRRLILRQGGLGLSSIFFLSSCFSSSCFLIIFMDLNADVFLDAVYDACSAKHK